MTRNPIVNQARRGGLRSSRTPPRERAAELVHPKATDLLLRQSLISGRIPASSAASFSPLELHTLERLLDTCPRSALEGRSIHRFLLPQSPAATLPTGTFKQLGVPVAERAEPGPELLTSRPRARSDAHRPLVPVRVVCSIQLRMHCGLFHLSRFVHLLLDLTDGTLALRNGGDQILVFGAPGL